MEAWRPGNWLIHVTPSLRETTQAPLSSLLKVACNGLSIVAVSKVEVCLFSQTEWARQHLIAWQGEVVSSLVRSRRSEEMLTTSELPWSTKCTVTDWACGSRLVIWALYHKPSSENLAQQNIPWKTQTTEVSYRCCNCFYMYKILLLSVKLPFFLNWIVMKDFFYDVLSNVSKS